MYILMQPAEYVGFEAAVRAQALAACIVQRQTLFEAKMRLVLDGSPWPEVLLVGTGEACSR
jgi:hypothetical protein